jgi:radical SAM protein with 4Fe4S-binding SPASM domain
MLFKTFAEINNIRKEYGPSIFRGMFTLGINSLCYLLDTRMLGGPLYVGFDITYRCNFRCSYCDRWKIKSKEKELSTEEIKNMIREFGKMGVWLLSFNGGEPLLRQDIGELIKEAKKNNIVTDINTNGSLLKEKAKMLIDSGIDVISVSVESYDAKIHDSIRNFPNSFKLLSEGIAEVIRLRGKKKKPLIKVRPNLGKNNYKDFVNYIEYWLSKGADDIIIQPLHECPGNYFRIPKKMRFSAKDKEEFEKSFNLLLKKYKWLNTTFYREFPTFFFSREELYKKYYCFAGSFFAQVDPYGNVYICNQYTRKVGDIRKKSFREIWNNSEIRKARDDLRDKRTKCICWYNCNGTPNCYLTKILKSGL